MKKLPALFILLFAVTALKAQINPADFTGAWQETKRTTNDGDLGRDYTLDGEPFSVNKQLWVINDKYFKWGFENSAKELKYKLADSILKILDKDNDTLISQYRVVKLTPDKLVLEAEPPNSKDKDELLICKYYFKKLDKIPVPEGDSAGKTIINIDSLKKALGKDDVTVMDVEKQPEFQGGYVALSQFIKDNLRYPSKANENGWQGSVIAKFVVEKDGSISTLEFIGCPYKLLAKEVRRIIQLMPDFIPGTQNGNPVRVSYIIPVKFKLK